MRHALYKYYSDRKWAEEFLDGRILFRPLAYFRDYEDHGVRGDQGEGTSIYRPDGGLIVNNQTRGITFTLSGHTFESTVKQDGIFVFCASRSQSDVLRQKFDATACVEIQNIKAFCERVKAALPPNSTFRGRRVEYYKVTESGNPRWALPDRIATSKQISYAWQHEYRLIFSLTDALQFENVEPRLLREEMHKPSQKNEHPPYFIQTQNLQDICCLHVF